MSADRAATARAAGVARLAPTRPWLTVVPPLRTGAPRAPFVLLVATLLTGGLVALLFLHTALAEDSFALHDLRARSLVLADREQALEQQVAQAASPQRLAARARALGMVRSENPTFIRISDATILGVPKAGTTPPPPPAPKPTATAPASPVPSATASSATAKKKKPVASTAASGPGATPTPSPGAR